ncbi:hypothetical protein HK098_005595, partial [Nowakowskiella sp. JEL0407]
MLRFGAIGLQRKTSTFYCTILPNYGQHIQLHRYSSALVGVDTCDYKGCSGAWTPVNCYYYEST